MYFDYVLAEIQSWRFTWHYSSMGLDDRPTSNRPQVINRTNDVPAAQMDDKATMS